MLDRDAVDLEITIRPSGTAYVADARMEQPGNQAVSVLATDVPVTLDPTALLALSLNPTAYGRALTEQLFADQRLRDAWQRACTLADDESLPLRLRLCLPATIGDIHALRWETLHDPQSLTDVRLATDDRRRLVRSLNSSDIRRITLGPKSALFVVANPSDLGRYGMAEIDVEGEVGRVRKAIGGIALTVVGDMRRATLSAIQDALRTTSPTILCLMCHGKHTGDDTDLWLENDDGTTVHVKGSTLSQMLSQVRPPLLVILIACEGGGNSHHDSPLAALGPRLALAGVGAVLAMQDTISMSAAKRLLPVLFEELARDGRIDRAVSHARAALSTSSTEWWVPALWLRVRDGQLFTESVADLEEGINNTVQLKKALRDDPSHQKVCAQYDQVIGQIKLAIQALLNDKKKQKEPDLTDDERTSLRSLLARLWRYTLLRAVFTVRHADPRLCIILQQSEQSERRQHARDLANQISNPTQRREALALLDTPPSEHREALALLDPLPSEAERRSAAISTLVEDLQRYDKLWAKDVVAKIAASGDLAAPPSKNPWVERLEQELKAPEFASDYPDLIAKLADVYIAAQWWPKVESILQSSFPSKDSIIIRFVVDRCLAGNISEKDRTYLIGLIHRDQRYLTKLNLWLVSVNISGLELMDIKEELKEIVPLDPPNDSPQSDIDWVEQCRMAAEVFLRRNDKKTALEYYGAINRHHTLKEACALRECRDRLCLHIDPLGYFRDLSPTEQANLLRDVIRLLANTGRYEDLDTLLNTYIPTLEPADQVDAWCWAARICGQGNPKYALRYLKRACLRLSQDGATFKAQIGIIYQYANIEQDPMPTARKIFDRIDPRDDGERSDLVECAAALCWFERAESHLRQIPDNAPQRAQALEQLIAGYACCGDLQSARQHLGTLPEAAYAALLDDALVAYAEWQIARDQPQAEVLDTINQIKDLQACHRLRVAYAERLLASRRFADFHEFCDSHLRGVSEIDRLSIICIASQDSDRWDEVQEMLKTCDKDTINLRIELAREAMRQADCYTKSGQSVLVKLRKKTTRDLLDLDIIFPTPAAMDLETRSQNLERIMTIPAAMDLETRSQNLERIMTILVKNRELFVWEYIIRSWAHLDIRSWAHLDMSADTASAESYMFNTASAASYMFDVVNPLFQIDPKLAGELREQTDLALSQCEDIIR